MHYHSQVIMAGSAGRQNLLTLAPQVYGVPPAVSSELVADIKPGENPANFDLKSK